MRAPPLAHRVVLRLVERIAAERADGPEGGALVRAHDALRRVLDDQEPVTAGDVHDHVHLARDAGIVDRHYHARAVGYGRLDLGLVDVHGVGADVDEDEPRPGEDERRGGGGEGEARQDDLVARLKLAEQRRHLERRGARGGEQRLLGAEPVLQPLVAAHRERAVPGDLVVGLACLAHVLDLSAEEGRNVEGNSHVGLPHESCGRRGPGQCANNCTTYQSGTASCRPRKAGA